VKLVRPLLTGEESIIVLFAVFGIQLVKGCRRCVAHCLLIVFRKAVRISKDLFVGAQRRKRRHALAAGAVGNRRFFFRLRGRGGFLFLLEGCLGSNRLLEELTGLLPAELRCLPSKGGRRRSGEAGSPRGAGCCHRSGVSDERIRHALA
jgi:hypothetical protein